LILAPSSGLALGYQDGQVWLWDMANPGFPLPLSQPFTNSAFQIASMALGPGGRTPAASTSHSAQAHWH
jgi:hypothetical protein